MILGLTGSMGSGKTSAAKYFKKLQVHIVDADEISRQITSNNKAIDKLVEIFGKQIIYKNGRLNRKKLARIIFSNAELRLQCERVLHPLIKLEIKKQISQFSKNDFVVLDAPLLFEAGLDKLCDKTLVVWTKESLIAPRLKARHFSAAEIKERRNAQMPDDKKMQKADFVIDNSYSIKTLEKNIEALFWQINKSKK
ncbi:MAG: dephospho-CoA kinase [Elusimicrobiota bacterium]|jgi:dephospho-CoA kinase|nr:dephospho-CoA kinase [Elusimicrobiota bacterium]